MTTHGALSEIRLQVMWNRLLAVVEDQARTLMSTAFSATVREAGDLSAGVFDTRGRMIAQAVTGTPGHVNSMAEAVPHFLAKFPIDVMADGDASLIARWKISGPNQNGALLEKKSIFSKPVNAQSYEAKVSAMSRLIEDFSQEIAAAINAMSRKNLSQQ